MRKKQGFTLLELVVAMAIFAVLVAMGLFGIQIVQTSLRNTERLKAADEMRLFLSSFLQDANGYPESVYTVAGTESGIGTSIVFVSGNISKTLQLKGAAVVRIGQDLSGPSGSAYCYEENNGAYRLGVNLEGSSEWRNLGNDTSGTCDEQSLIQTSGN